MARKSFSIFLASSKDMQEERDAILRLVELERVERRCKIPLFRFEDTTEQSQDEIIKDAKCCDIFIILFDKRVGKYSGEEFEEAVSQSKISPNKPLIRVFGRRMIGDYDGVSRAHLRSRFDFIDRCEELRLFPKYYTEMTELTDRIRKVIEKYCNPPRK